MILKKIPVDQEKAAKKSKATNISDLTDYVSVPGDAARLTRLGYHLADDGDVLGGNGEQPEKLLYLTTRGFNTGTFKGQQAEMIAVAMECPKSKNPVQHWIASWHENEQPSPEQIEEFLDVFLNELGLRKHQVIAAVHRDTDNIHCHVAINKVSPETYKVIKPAKGWDIEAAHRTVAIIEHGQGWQSEPNGRYTVQENGQIARVGDLKSKPRKPSRAADMERRTGQKSVATIAIEEAGELIRSADCWADLHAALGARGMRYVKEGSGAKIYLGDQPVKASTAGYWCSFPKLSKRLGTFEPASGVVPVPRKSEPIRPDMPGWDDYDSARLASKADRQRKMREAKERHAQERSDLRMAQARIRADIAEKDWRGKGELLNAIRSVAASNRKKAELDLREKQSRELESIKAHLPAWPPYEEWLRKWYSPTDAHDYRYHRHEPLRIEGDGEIEARPHDLRAFVGEVVAGTVEYHLRAEGGRIESLASFIDHGRRIDVQEAYDQDAALAALQLGAAKWGGKVRLYGSEAYQAMCVKLAVEHGIQITNPELQEQFVAAKEARQKAREEALRIPQAKLFDAYHQAVQADRYSVTVIKMTATEHKAFLLKPKDGLEASAIERRMRELVQIQSRGENVYYTPRSERMHHVLIDDLTTESLQRLQAGGYRPAVVLESSPARYQVILNVPKLGLDGDEDRVVGNRLCQQLNKLYGDPNLTGVIHPHRAPGFDNRKWVLGASAPKYRRKDGSYPVVVLHHAEHCTCDRALALSCVVARQVGEEKMLAKVLRPAPAVAASSLPNEAYLVHYRDIAAKNKNGADLSLVDAMIAERMRMTGHTQSEIQLAIEACAPSIRATPEGRNWSDYAARTAAYAYSAAANRKLSRMGRYRDQFLQLEGRQSDYKRVSLCDLEP